MKNMWIGWSVICTVFMCVILAAVLDAGGDYKSYRDRSLMNTMSMNTDLTDSEINYLISLPSTPTLVSVVGDSVFVGGEWFMLDSTETVGVHFNGCRGKVIFNLINLK